MMTSLFPMRYTCGDLRGAHKAPSFFDGSSVALEDLASWIGKRAEGVAPWVARVHLNGPNLPKGSWEVLSSEAFLTVPLQWYVLLSAGTLRPKVQEVHAHPMGMNAWPVAENKTKKADRQWNAPRNGERELLFC